MSLLKAECGCAWFTGFRAWWCTKHALEGLRK